MKIALMEDIKLVRAKIDDLSDKIVLFGVAIDEQKKLSDDLSKDIVRRQEKFDQDMKTVLKQNSREKADVMIDMDNLKERIKHNDK
jgi:polyhydroxyalkanoate synthesis regulator phasin